MLASPGPTGTRPTLPGYPVAEDLLGRYFTAPALGEIYMSVGKVDEPDQHRRLPRRRAGCTRASTLESESNHLGRGVPVGGRSVPQLAVAVVSPAFGGTTLHQRTRVRVAGADRCTTGEPGHLGWGVPIGDGAVTQLSTVVMPPAIGAPTQEQRTRQSPTGGNRCHPGQSRHLGRSVPVGDGVVPQLSNVVPAPAFGDTTRHE